MSQSDVKMSLLSWKLERLSAGDGRLTLGEMSELRVSGRLLLLASAFLYGSQGQFVTETQSFIPTHLIPVANAIPAKQSRLSC